MYLISGNGSVTTSVATADSLIRLSYGESGSAIVSSSGTRYGTDTSKETGYSFGAGVFAGTSGDIIHLICAVGTLSTGGLTGSNTFSIVRYL